MREKMHLVSVSCCVLMEVDLQIVIVHPMKAYSGSTRITPLILYPGTRCKWVTVDHNPLRRSHHRSGLFCGGGGDCSLCQGFIQIKLANRYLWKLTNYWRKSLRCFQDVWCRQMDSQKYRSWCALFFVAKNLMDFAPHRRYSPARNVGYCDVWNKDVGPTCLCCCPRQQCWLCFCW
jgi:hypothetical protein